MEPKNQIKDIKKFIRNNARGYKTLSTKIYKLIDRVDIKCPQGHLYDVRFVDFKDGRRCPYCCGNKRLTIEIVRNRIKELAPDYTLISTEYKNRSGKLMFQCPNDHQFEKSLDAFEFMGQRCIHCNRVAKEKNSKATKTSVATTEKNELEIGKTGEETNENQV